MTQVHTSKISLHNYYSCRHGDYWKITININNKQCICIFSTMPGMWRSQMKSTSVGYGFHALFRGCGCGFTAPTTCKQCYQTRETWIRIWNYVELFQYVIKWVQVKFDSSFNLPIIAGYLTCLASFSTLWVWLCFVYHFVLFCRPGTQNYLPFLNANPNLNSTKNSPHICNRFGCGKIVRFRHLNSNLNSDTPLNNAWYCALCLLGKLCNFLPFLFQPEFQSKCVDAVQVISKQPLVADEAKFLVEAKSCAIGDLSLQNNLNTDT